MINSLTDLDLSKLTTRLPCGDVTFQRKFALEYLLISDYEYKKHQHDQRHFCEEIVYECLLTWKKNLEEKGEVATNQKLITILDNVRKEGLIKKEDFRFLEEAPDPCFPDKFKRYRRWFKKFLKTQCWLIFAAVFIFVSGYFELASFDVCACSLSICLLVKLFNDGEILMFRFFRKDQENKFQQEGNEFQQEDTEQAEKIPNNFTFQISEAALSCDIEEKLAQFTKLKKISKSDAASSIPHIKFKCVMKKRENDILLEIYDLNDMLRVYDIQDFVYQQEIRNTLEAAFIGGGILRVSGPFVTKNSEKVTVTVEFYMSPWDSKLESMSFWVSRYFMRYTSRIKFGNYDSEFEVKLDGFTTAKDVNILIELNNKNAKIDEVTVCPITFFGLKGMADYEKQPSYEFLESLCLKALSRGDPLAMQRIIRDALISPERKPDQNNGRNFAGGKKNAKRAYETTFHSSRKSIPVAPVHELSSPATHFHELLSSPARHVHKLSNPTTHGYELLSRSARHVYELSSPATHSHELLSSPATHGYELLSCPATHGYELLSSPTTHGYELLSRSARHVYEWSSPATHSHELLSSQATHGYELLSCPATHGYELLSSPTTHGYDLLSRSARHVYELSSPATHSHELLSSQATHGYELLSCPATHGYELLSSPARHVYELSSPATHFHELSWPTTPVCEFSRAAHFSKCSSAATDFCELSNPTQLPMCYSAVNYSVSCLMSMGQGYLGLN